MTTQKSADWLRQEHEKVHELAIRLQERVSILPRTNREKWIQDVRDAFDDFRSHMTKHMAIEEQDGYMASVVEMRPALAREVDRLAHEHLELTQIMDSIQVELHDLRGQDHLLILDCCRRIQNLLQYLEHHEKDECLVLLSTYSTDVGTAN